MGSDEIRSKPANSPSFIDARTGFRKVSLLASRFFLSNKSIRSSQPGLIDISLSGIIIGSTCAPYCGLKKTSHEPRRQRLQKLTQQPATISQESPPLSLIEL
jgi:hypothetical protein